MSDRELRLWLALKTITCYDSPDKLRKRAQRDYGLNGEEAIEYAYENVLQEARNAIKGMRRPKVQPLPKPRTDKPRDAQPLTRCAAARDGDCSHAQCPQVRDGEPNKSGRACPLENWSDE